MTTEENSTDTIELPVNSTDSSVPPPKTPANLSERRVILADLSVQLSNIESKIKSIPEQTLFLINGSDNIKIGQPTLAENENPSSIKERNGNVDTKRGNGQSSLNGGFDPDMSNSEQYYQKAMDATFKAMEAHAKAAEVNSGQLRWVMGIGVTILSLLIGGIYFTNAGLRNEMNANTQSIQNNINSLRGDIKSMGENIKDHQSMYERVIDERTKK